MVTSTDLEHVCPSCEMKRKRQVFCSDCGDKFELPPIVWQQQQALGPAQSQITPDED